MNELEPLPNELLRQIANEYGTPVYVYDAESIINQFEKLKSAFVNVPAKFFYACKALTNINILQILLKRGSNVDCSSINEVKIALKVGFKPEQIIFTSNGVRFSEIQEAVELGIHINIDNLSTLRKFSVQYGGGYPISLRLRPNIMAGGHIKISTGHEMSKFGIPIEFMDEILNIVATHSVVVDGLHIHTGSDIADVGVYIQEVEVMLQLLEHFPGLRFIDLGGGLKVPYDDHDLETDINELAIRIHHLFSRYRRADGSPYEIWLEPGKFIVSKCGYLLATVNVLQKTANTMFAYLDTGFNHLIRPMFYDAFHKIANISNPAGRVENYYVVGNLCETDTFAEDRSISEIREGDVLAIYNAGAYGFEMAMNYNARFRPAEVLVEGKSYRMIRKRETLENLLELQIWG